MKIWKTSGIVGIAVAVIAAAAFSFAKIQHDPIPHIALGFHKVSKPVAESADATKNDIIGKAAAIVPASLHDADASEQATLGEGQDPTLTQTSTAAVSIKNASGIPVLMYHYVGDLPSDADATRKDLTVSTANFTAQVSWLKSQGYVSITEDQLYTWLKNGTAIPAKSVMFTFDDGYSDVFENAVPVLVANGMTGSFGIITGYVATSDYATWDQIISAKNQGMQIVSHSYSHPDFSSKSRTDQTYEITKSDLDFDTELGSVPQYFIYPYGKYDATTESILNSNGFLMSFTTAYGFVRTGENLLELPRVRVHGAESLQTFEYGLIGQK